MSINPQFIYCHATGKPIAKIDDESWLTITMSLISLDPEEAADELETRALTSMRPSVLWQSITKDSLEYVRVAAPKELLAYLMNRMYAPIEHSKAKPITFESRLSALRFRTELWQIIDSTEFGPDQLEQLLMILLALDTAFNLSRMAKPTSVAQAWSQDITTLISVLGAWHDRLTAEQVKLAHEARISDQWWRAGNQHTSKAFVAAAITTKPLSKTAEKKIAKKAEQSIFDQIASAIFAGAGIEPVGQQPRVEGVKQSFKVGSEAAADRVISAPKNRIIFKRVANHG